MPQLTARTEAAVILPRDTNQALGIGQFAVDFMRNAGEGGGDPDTAVLDRTRLFHTDASLCGISALALGTNAPTILRDEALQYAVPSGPLGKPLGRCAHHGATVFGSTTRVKSEKAILANAAAVREWDSNGTNFGYSEVRPEHRAGEFGHNDFYPVAIAAAQMMGRGGDYALRGMVLLDEIRGRLAEVFSLKTYKIDHVVHGAIASAATFGAMVGANPEQIESAIGLVVAHFIPFRAIRAGKQLSDSKGSSAAISTEAAILSMKRSMAGFIGPRDIFRNPEAIFCLFGRPREKGASPFDLHLSRAGSDFAVMGMHFKLGLYEHQSAGALQGLITLLEQNPRILAAGPQGLESITIVAYEPAFGIIGDPAKRDPRTRQSADHSMVYIVSTLLRKAFEQSSSLGGKRPSSNDEHWKALMLGPYDYSHEAIMHRETRALMEKVSFEHGGAEYDRRYPDGIPTSIVINTADGKRFDSGLVMYPAGHARNTTANLDDILDAKFSMLAGLAVADSRAIIERFNRLPEMTAAEVQSINDLEILDRGTFE
jgi:2-methylcitrate dehydratase